MTLIIPPGHAQVVITWQGPMFDSGGAATTCGFGTTVADSPVALTAFATEVRAATVANLLPQLDSDVRMTKVEAFGETASGADAGSWPGTASGLAPAPSIALLVKKVTGRRGPRGQGRMFLPAMLRQGDVNEDGTLTTPALTTAQAAIDGWLSQIATDTDQLPVLLQNTGGITPHLDPPPAVNSMTVDPKVATQRRRLRR